MIQRITALQISTTRRMFKCSPVHLTTSPVYSKAMSPKILIVEDNQDTREIMKHYFSIADFTPLTAEDGNEGFIKAKAELPQLIITDLAMPNLNGVDMIKELHADSDTAQIPILIFTARGSGIAKDGLKAGALKAFYKPLDFDALVDEVKALIESQESSH